MSKKTMTVLGVAAIAVVALVLYARSRARSAAAAARVGGEIPPPLSTSAQVAGAFSNFVGSLTNWGAQWVNEGGRRIGNTVVQAMPTPLGEKDVSSVNADPRRSNLVTTPQPYN